MSSVQPPSPASHGTRNTAEGRLRDALVQFPRSLFCSEEPKHESELREPPEDLTVVTMIEALELVGTERVLELGSPTAYTAALLSHLAAEVYSVVSEQERAEQRGRDLHALGCRNVHVVLSPPQLGWPGAAPYQAIVVGAAAAQVPLELIHQLDLDGRLVISIGDENGQLMERVYKGHGALKSETLGSCHLGMLADARHTPSLVPWVHQPRSE
jgi:protein-L-isoaspartate(D-aspartate) O-methyltransferase